MTEQEVIDFFAGKLALAPIGFCGEGAFGKVLLANDQLGRLLVLKIVDKATLGSGWIREFNGLCFYCQNIHDHSHLIAIHHVEDYGDYFCYTMEAADNIYKGEKGLEYYKPDTLDNRIIKKQTFTPGEILEIAEELLAGLKVLHEAGLIHRDVKPANVIFVDGKAKLGDMGLVTNATETHSFAGTPGFLPPELIAELDNKTTNDAAGDLYALGKVIYCMLTGLSAKSFPEIPYSLVKSPFTRRLNQFLLVACGENRMKRYRTVESFQKALQKVKVSLRPRSADGHLGWMLCGAVALLVLLLAVPWVFRGCNDDSSSKRKETTVAPLEERPSEGDAQNVDASRMKGGGAAVEQAGPGTAQEDASPPEETKGDDAAEQTGGVPEKGTALPRAGENDKGATEQAVGVPKNKAASDSAGTAGANADGGVAEKAEAPLPEKPAEPDEQQVAAQRKVVPAARASTPAGVKRPGFRLADPRRIPLAIGLRYTNARIRLEELGYGPGKFRPTKSVDDIGRDLEDFKANFEEYRGALRWRQANALQEQSAVKHRAAELDLTQFDAQRSEALQRQLSDYVSTKLFRRSSYPSDEGMSKRILEELRSGKIDPNLMVETRFSIDGSVLACTCRELFPNSKEIARTLIGLGADTTHLNNERQLLMQTETGMTVVCEGGFDNMKGFLVGLLGKAGGNSFPVDDIAEKLVFLNHNLVDQDELGNTALHYAVRRGSMRLVALMACADANPNVQNAKGETPLFEAVRYGYREIEELLLFIGANPEIADKEGRRAEDCRLDARFMQAVKEHDVKGVREQLQAGIPVDTCFADGTMPLRFACEQRDVPMIKLLLEYHATLEGNVVFCLDLAFVHKEFDLIKMLLEGEGIQIDRHRLLLSLCENYRHGEQYSRATKRLTTVREPINLSDEEKMRYLELFLPYVKGEEQLRDKSSPPRLLLDYALAAKQSGQFIERLLRVYRSLPETAPLVAVAIQNDYGDETVRMLLERKANPNALYRTGAGWVHPITLATSKERPETIKLLQQYGASLDGDKQEEAVVRQKGDSQGCMRLLRSMTLVSAEGEKTPADGILKDKKRIGLYFSIVNVYDVNEVQRLNWFYESCQKKGLSLELILLRYDVSFLKVLDYMRRNGLKWHSAPDDRYESYRQLMKRFKVREQPCLVVLDEDGNVLSQNGIWDVVMYGDQAYELWGTPDYKPATRADYSKSRNKAQEPQKP